MKTLGIITDIETRDIQLLVERKNSLEELLLILNSNNDKDLFYKVKSELIIAESKCAEWWEYIMHKYKWSFKKDNYYEVDFITHEILVSDSYNLLSDVQ